MGLNCVAVLLNDKCHDFERHGEAIGNRISYAMQNWNSITNDGYFNAGRVISRDHADGYQITVVHGNTGCHISDAEGLPLYALEQLADCLKRHGWLARRPPRTRKPPVQPEKA